jgi:hypothetical protein
VTELLAAVLDYASRGWRVIALHHMTVYNGQLVCSCRRRGECKAPAKHPMFSKWRAVATVDPDRLKSWWRAWPRANVGILMGGMTSTVCIDIDGEKGRESLAQLEEEHGALPETLMQSTGRVGGGEHRLFHVDQFYLDWIKNRAAIAPGIDVRAEGGLIVAAPSIHPTGATYAWRNTTPIAELPEWMFKLAIAERSRQKEITESSGERPSEAKLIAWGWTLERRLNRARKVLSQMPPAVSGDQGHKRLLNAAIAIVRGYCVPVEPYNHAFEVLWEVFNPRCTPPWEEWEVQHKVKTAERDVKITWCHRLDSDPEAYYAVGLAPVMDTLFGEQVAPKVPVHPEATLAIVGVPEPLSRTAPKRVSEQRRIAPKLPKNNFELMWTPKRLAKEAESRPEPAAAPATDDDVEDCA